MLKRSYPSPGKHSLLKVYLIPATGGLPSKQIVTAFARTFWQVDYSPYSIGLKLRVSNLRALGR